MLAFELVLITQDICIHFSCVKGKLYHNRVVKERCLNNMTDFLLMTVKGLDCVRDLIFVNRNSPRDMHRI
jgi:hypothetical protein